MAVKMIATKPMTYKTRRLQAGDSFEVNTRQQATVWEKVRKTARLDYEVVAQPMPAEQSSALQSVNNELKRMADLDALQREAEAAGVRVDKRWGEARLRQEIASAASQKPPEPQPAPVMTTTSYYTPPPSGNDSVRGASDSVSSAVNVGSTAHPVYRRPDDDC